MQELAARLAEVAKLWNRIERRAKAAEQIRGEAIIPAINEMRYAGRRVVDGLAAVEWPVPGAPDDARLQELDEHLIMAKNYLVNADHDITDAICFLVLSRVSQAVEQHGMLRVCTVYPAFSELYPAVLEAQEIIRGSREDRRQRVAEYEKLADVYIPKFEELYRKLTQTRDLAVSEPTTGMFRQTWEKLDFLEALAAIGAIAGVIAVCLSVWDIFFIRPREMLELRPPAVAASIPSNSSTPGAPAPQSSP
jgi:hypothetical protein